MTLWIYCHSHTEQSEKSAYSIIKTTTDGTVKAHSLYVFTIDLSKNMEAKLNLGVKPAVSVPLQQTRKSL